MNVSDLARTVGIAPSAVRFYERRGILPRAPRQANGYREYTEGDLCRLRIVVSLRRASTCRSPADSPRSARAASAAMARDLLPLVSAQRVAIARSRSEIHDLDHQLAVLEMTLHAGGVDADLCLEKGGEIHDELRLRPELPMPADRLPVLNGH